MSFLSYSRHSSVTSTTRGVGAIAEQKRSIFRKETLDRISSPEQLTDYLRVTNPGVWVILAAIIIMLIGFFVWMSVGVIETTVPVGVSTQSRRATVAVKSDANTSYRTDS